MQIKRMPTTRQAFWVSRGAPASLDTHLDHQLSTWPLLETQRKRYPKIILRKNGPSYRGASGHLYPPIFPNPPSQHKCLSQPNHTALH